MISTTKASTFLLLATATAIAMLALASQASAADEPVTAAADSLRTGWYPENAQLTPQLLEEEGGFGRIFDTPVQGQVYAQPLVFGHTLLAATEDNWIYGIDPQSGAVQWSRNVGTPWNSADIGCTDLEPHVGITGTPVIDPATNVAYFFSKTYASGHSGPAVWKMHAVDLSSGEEEPGFPVLISGEAQNLPGVEFNPTQQLQRPALLLMNGVVYAAFGSHCDIQPYQGWIFGVSTAGQIKTRWATSSTGSAIWQAGGGLVSDGEGQILFATGNGPPPPPGPGHSPPEGELGESVVRVGVQPDGTLKATDFFSPFENTIFNESDLDLGSGAPMALPAPYFGTKAIPNLMVEVGKPGIFYLLNRENLGGMGQGPEGTDAVVQEIPGTGGLWGSMATWPGDGGYIYVPAVGSGALEMLKYGTEEGMPHLSIAGYSPGYLGFGSGSPIVTSNGTTSGSGIVWLSECSNPPECEGSRLNAYSAVPVEESAKLLWSGEIGVSTKFARPDASEGRIYVGTRDGHLLGFGPTHYTLSVTREPEAGGSVSSDVPGIDCGASCSHSFETGTQVTLTATPAEHFEFRGWSGGGCSGTATCKVTVYSDTEVKAAFSPILHDLRVSKEGSGSGTVSSEPAGIQCGGTCLAQYSSGTLVTLTATPAEHSEFKSWSGACSGIGTCEVTMNEAKTVGADFILKPSFKLSVSDSGLGEGTVTSSPGGIDCGASCEGEFEKGVIVTLVPAASEDSEFKGWNGACAGIGTCEVTMNEAKLVNAEFALAVKPKFKLSVSESGPGQGTVTSSPAGIACGASCEASYEEGTEVTLTPAPIGRSEFKGWSGACIGTGGCEVTMSEAKSVSAEFAPEPKLSVSDGGPGEGSVTSSPAGISCGATCAAQYKSGTLVTLTATPAEHFQFRGWSGGGCSGTATCKVTVYSDTEVKAAFAPILHDLRVSKEGSGSGTVSSEPAGIQCGGTCLAQFNEGSTVALSASPGAQSAFTGWSGPDAGSCGSADTCKVTIGSADSSLTASFSGPPDTSLTKAKIDGKKRRASFSFGGSGTVTGFQCELIMPKSGHTSKPKAAFSSCSSPKAYRHLRHGRYSFEVRAINSAGADPTPAIRRFRI